MRGLILKFIIHRVWHFDIFSAYFLDYTIHETFEVDPTPELGTFTKKKA